MRSDSYAEARGYRRISVTEHLRFTEPIASAAKSSLDLTLFGVQ
jgi:hypothetical protein